VFQAGFGGRYVDSVGAWDGNMETELATLMEHVLRQIVQRFAKIIKISDSKMLCYAM